MVMKNLSDRVVEIAHQMKRNAEGMCLWRNYPLAAEALELLKSTGDPEETPAGKALALDFILDYLSEYDTPRFCISLLEYELEQVQLSPEQDGIPDADELKARISKLRDWISPETVSDGEFYEKYSRYLKWDPLERTPLWEELYLEVEHETDALVGDAPRGMGFCFGYWAAKRKVLLDKGIEWKDPHIMNPRVMFD